jgi:hypothetical protein
MSTSVARSNRSTSAIAANSRSRLLTGTLSSNAVAPQKRLFKGADAFGHSPVEAPDQGHTLLIDFSDHGQIISVAGHQDRAVASSWRRSSLFAQPSGKKFSRKAVFKTVHNPAWVGTREGWSP